MVTIDSYSEANQDNQDYIDNVHPSANAFPSAVGQCFAAVGFAGYKLETAKFYLRKVGAPVGNLVAQLYDHTGVWGTSGKPTGAVLAESNAVAMASLGVAYALVTFTFPVPYYTLASQNYTIACVGKDAVTLEWANRVEVGRDQSAPTHGGNYFNYVNSAWSAWNGADTIFYVDGALPSVKSGLKMVPGMI